MKEFKNKHDALEALANGELFCEELVMSSDIVIPESYQRQRNDSRVRAMARAFDPYKVRKPRISYRNGKYYAFDGQHTIALLESMNGGKPLPILCEIVKDFSEADEAYEFSIQNDGCKPLTQCEKFRASVASGKNDEDTRLNKLTEGAGFKVSGKAGKMTISCVKKAKSCMKQYGGAAYSDALSIIALAWDGSKEAVNASIVSGMCRYARAYMDEYDIDKLCTALKKHTPDEIRRNAAMMQESKTTEQKVAYQIALIYNKAKRAGKKIDEYRVFGTVTKSFVGE